MSPREQAWSAEVCFPAMEIKGTAAIVSGGASGLGAATVRALAAAGAKVVIADLNEQLRNGQKILIDITAAQRNQLDQAIQGAQVTVEESKANIVKPDEEHVIWPFNGEYWRDELGFYRQTITSKCGR